MKENVGFWQLQAGRSSWYRSKKAKSHAKRKATCSLTSTSESVHQENRKQKGEEMEREVLSDGEKKEGIILAFHSWTITQVVNTYNFLVEKNPNPAITLLFMSLYHIILVLRSSLTAAQLVLIVSIWAVFSQST